MFQHRISCRFEPWCREIVQLFEYMPFVRVLESITFCSLFANPFHDFNHHSNQQQPPLPLLNEDMSSCLSLLVFCACNDVCVSLSLSDRFKCFHTADVFGALVLASIWSSNIIVRYKLFSLFAYSAEHRNSIFSYFQSNNFGCRTFGASLKCTTSVFLAG